jgi:hypothetical protein
MNAVLCFSALIVAALAPTTSHKQIRDADGRAWMLIRSKKVLVLHAPKAGQLQVLARSTSARSLRVRAAGEVIATEPLEPGQETVLPGQKTGAPALVRVPVPTGGEIFRVEVPRGRAWVAVSLLSPDGAVAFEQPEAATPGLVGLVAPPKKESTVPGLVGLAPLKSPNKTKPKATMPGLVALGDSQARKKNALKLAKRSPRVAPLVNLGPDKDKEKEKQGPAVIDRPITGLPPVEDQGEMVINKPKPTTRPPAQLIEPSGPTLLERLSTMQLGMSVAGLAQGRADRFGGQVELEIDVPGTQRLFAAALYVGYSPAQRSGVLRTGNGVALPVVVAQKTEEIPLGLTLRARPLRLNLGQKPLAVFAELQAGWHLRTGQTAIGMLRGSVQRDLNHTVDSSGITGGLGLGAELGLTKALVLGAHARVEASQAQEIDVPNLIRTQVEQSGASLALSIRYRFGS